MQALWLENQTLAFREDQPLPLLASGEALIRLRLAGICATDLEMVRGYYPFTGIPGHEFVGEVVDSPSASHWLGSRVVGEINVVCGVCSTCCAGRPTHCERRSVLGILGRDGCFAEYVALPLENLHVVPDSVSDQAAVFTEPLAAALEIQQQVHLQPMDSVLVVGAGRLGQLVAQCLVLTGCDLHVLVRHDRQRSLLKGRGIRPVSEADISGSKFDIVIEATGSPFGFALARQAVRPRGTLVLKSTYHGDVQVNLSSVVVDEVTLVGSRCGPFQPALRLLESSLVDPSGLVEACYPLHEGQAAFERAAQAGTLKVLLQPAVN